MISGHKNITGTNAKVAEVIITQCVVDHTDDQLSVMCVMEYVSEYR